MTRPGFGAGPAGGRHGAPPAGRHADAEPAPEGGLGRHAVPDETGADGRAAVERALRAPPPGERRRTRSTPAPVVTESDERPGQWNGFGPGALVLPTQPNGSAGGRHGSPAAGAPEPPPADNGYAPGPLAPTGNGYPTEPGLLSPAGDGYPSAPSRIDDDWQLDPPVPADGWSTAAGPQVAASDGHAGAPSQTDDWQVDPPVPADDWPAAGPQVAASNGHAGAPSQTDDWQVDPPVPADGWSTTPGPPPPADDWQPDPPAGDGWPAATGPSGWRAAEPEPPGPGDWRAAEPEPFGVNGHHAPSSRTDDWQVDRPSLRPAARERIGDLPAPVDDWQVDRPDGRPTQLPPQRTQPRTQAPADVPLNGWHVAEAAPRTPPEPAPSNRRRPDATPLPPPSTGWRAADLPRPAPPPVNGHTAAAHPLGERVLHVFDGDSTQLLRRYVPAKETLDREDGETASARAATRPKHPPRAVVRRRRTRRRLLEWPFLIVFALLSAYLIRAYVVQTFYIPSGSMHETLLEGDRVLVNKVSYHLHEVNRGDVVVFRRPPDFPVEDEDLIKRVVALPGETVEARGRQIYVDGKPLTEPYVEPQCQGTQSFPAVTVPAGELWVMGDNRCNSSDSRVFGPISEDLLVGRAFVLAWPFARLSWL